MGGVLHVWPVKPTHVPAMTLGVEQDVAFVVSLLLGRRVSQWEYVFLKVV
jgi:hypothetical protein